MPPPTAPPMAAPSLLPPEAGFGAGAGAACGAAAAAACLAAMGPTGVPCMGTIPLVGADVLGVIGGGGIPGPEAGCGAGTAGRGGAGRLGDGAATEAGGGGRSCAGGGFGSSGGGLGLVPPTELPAAGGGGLGGIGADGLVPVGSVGAADGVLASGSGMPPPILATPRGGGGLAGLPPWWTPTPPSAGRGFVGVGFWGEIEVSDTVPPDSVNGCADTAWGLMIPVAKTNSTSRIICIALRSLPAICNVRHAQNTTRGWSRAAH